MSLYRKFLHSTAENLPGNIGFITTSKKNPEYKIFGNKPDVGGQIAAAIDESKNIHVWDPEGYRIIYAKKTTDEEGWNTIQKKKISEKIKKVPCPVETEIRGECPHKDKHHKSLFYHFARTSQRVDDKPVCIYFEKSNRRKCWMLDDPHHKSMFHHF